MTYFLSIKTVHRCTLSIHLRGLLKPYLVVSFSSWRADKIIHQVHSTRYKTNWSRHKEYFNSVEKTVTEIGFTSEFTVEIRKVTDEFRQAFTSCTITSSSVVGCNHNPQDMNILIKEKTHASKKTPIRLSPPHRKR